MFITLSNPEGDAPETVELSILLNDEINEQPNIKKGVYILDLYFGLLIFTSIFIVGSIIIIFLWVYRKCR